MTTSFSRRQFLNMVGASGGSAAVYQASVALGLIPAVASAHQSLTRLSQAGHGINVIVLGAGLSGLASAYELERAGYNVTVIEASNRIGGRNLTVRNGDVIDEMGNPQVCQFDNDPSLYLNCGPARIPAHHQLILHYCREFGVALEPFINVNYQAWVHDSELLGGKPVRQQEFLADARGFMTELTAKSVDKAAFEAEFSAEDFERLMGFLRTYGDLGENMLYKGSSRAGYASGGMANPPVKKTPIDFSEILKSSFWQFRMHWGEGESQAAPLMQAVGGNDNIVKGFIRNIRSPIITGAPVQSIQLKEDGVEVLYDLNGKIQKASAHYCFNCIPKHLLHGIPNNFPRKYNTAMANVGRGKLAKIGLQMKDRFWEKEQIYGGITWTNQQIEQIWYPSSGFHNKKGILVGSYLFNDDTNDLIARMPPAERIEFALSQGEQIHPQYRDNFEQGITIVWHRMNYLMGCTATWSKEAQTEYFKTLQDPVGRHYLIGDQISYHPGWQEGAISSAHHALADLENRVTNDMGKANA